MTKVRLHSSSFRDPSGFIFIQDDTLYRQVNNVYKNDYDKLMQSGLFDELVKSECLVNHTEETIDSVDNQNSYKIIRPTKIPFVTYPYEWSFDQLKQAALLTLKIQKKAIDYGMSLKDASAYNIQFLGCVPVFIDTLSFEDYIEGEPWTAYKQFCQHFFGPLALMSQVDISLNKLLRTYIDGVPLELTSNLLPSSANFNFSLLLHIILHSKSQKTYADKSVKLEKKNFSKMSMLGLIEGLETAIKKLSLKKADTEWGDYYSFTNYSDKAFEKKKNIVSEMIDAVNPKMLWDMGANNGTFSGIASAKGIYTVAFDIDPIAVGKNYNEGRAKQEKNMLPVVLDLTNPSPDIGWNNNERMAITKRGRPDLLMALALVHHLAISNNVPLDMVAEYFSNLADNLVIEFVPKEDSQVKKLLMTRKDIFPLYNLQGFKDAFGKYFFIEQEEQIPGTDRSLFLMRKK